MKRSAFILNLAKQLRYYEQINNCSEEELNNLPLDAYLDTVNMVIEWAEKLGMMPPFNHDEYYRTWRDGKDGYAWDKED